MTPLIEAATLRATAQGQDQLRRRARHRLDRLHRRQHRRRRCSSRASALAPSWCGCSALLAHRRATSWFGAACAIRRRRAHARSAPASRASRALLRNRRFVILIVACGLIQSAHAFYYGFSTSSGAGRGFRRRSSACCGRSASPSKSHSSGCLPFIERRTTPEGAHPDRRAAAALCAGSPWALRPPASCCGRCRRCTLFSFAAAHVGAMRLLYRETPEHAAAMAQTLYAGLVRRPAHGRVDAAVRRSLRSRSARAGYWAMAALAAAGGALALLLLPPKPRAPAATPR